MTRPSRPAPEVSRTRTTEPSEVLMNLSSRPLTPPGPVAHEAGRRRDRADAPPARVHGLRGQAAAADVVGGGEDVVAVAVEGGAVEAVAGHRVELEHPARAAVGARRGHVGDERGEDRAAAAEASVGDDALARLGQVEVPAALVAEVGRLDDRVVAGAGVVLRQADRMRAEAVALPSAPVPVVPENGLLQQRRERHRAGDAGVADGVDPLRRQVGVVGGGDVAAGAEGDEEAAGGELGDVGAAGDGVPGAGREQRHAAVAERPASRRRAERGRTSTGCRRGRRHRRCRRCRRR